MVIKTVLGLIPVVLSTLVLYLGIIFTMSLLGKHHTTELTVTELVILMVLGSSVETAMIAGNSSLLAGLTSAATLLLGNRLLSLLVKRWSWLRRIVIGQPIPLIYHSRFLHPQIRKAGLTQADVMEGIRERGYEKLEDVRLAVLELDGSISVIANDLGKEK
ncbi:MAG TPA: YetF domain-containing protein [Anaerolineaceae bacterium]